MNDATQAIRLCLVFCRVVALRGVTAEFVRAARVERVSGR